METEIYKRGMDAAVEQAEKSWAEGGIPIGSAILSKAGEIVAAGHNQRVQQGDPTAHGEMDCIRNAGRRRDWHELTIVSTLSPCAMCTGTIILHKVPRVIIGENITFQGREDWLKAEGVEVINLNDERCIALMQRMIRERPELWNEDIGIPPSE